MVCSAGRYTGICSYLQHSNQYRYSPSAGCNLSKYRIAPVLSDIVRGMRMRAVIELES